MSKIIPKKTTTILFTLYLCYRYLYYFYYCTTAARIQQYVIVGVETIVEVDTAATTATLLLYK